MQHGLIWWIVVGGLAGVLAKAISPGDKGEPKGCILTILLGIAGSVIVGFLMRHFMGTTGGGGLLGSIVGATIGAFALIFLLKAVWSRG